MARSGALGGGTLNPFGSATTDFGAFNVGESAATKTVSAQEQASLAFAVTRAQHDNGLITDAEYAAAYATYSAGLDMKTQAGATAQYDLAMMQYTNDRNSLAQAVQSGNASYEQLLAFDAAAMSQTVPGSTEYMQRQDRYWSSQANVFQDKEAVMLDALKLGKLTNEQAQDWYNQEVTKYGDNFQIVTDVQDKIGSLKQTAIGDADQAMATAWNGGHMMIEQVMAYVAKAALDDPTGTRVTNLQQFAQQAKLQNVEAMASRRYALTKQYEQLAEIVAAADTKKLGSTTKTTSTRTLIDPSAPNGWHTVTTVGTKSHPPTVAQIAAKAKADAAAKAATAQMADIKKTISALPGGWFTDANYVALLAQQQALLVKNTPEWLSLQAKIDSHNQQIEQAKAQAAAGVRVTYPTVGSELDLNSMYVSSAERAAYTGLKTKALNQVQGWGQEIGQLREQLASGNLTDDQITQINARIQTDQAYIKNALKGVEKAGADLTAKSVATKAAATGGGAAHAGTPATRTNAPTVSVPVGTKAERDAVRARAVAANGGKPVTEQRVTDIINKANAAKETGPAVPSTFVMTSGNAAAFDVFHWALTNAITKGEPSFTDPGSGKQYALPTDPAKRLAILNATDQQNTNLKLNNLLVAESRPGTSDHQLASARSAYATAKRTQQSNKAWIIDTRDAGSVIASSPIYGTDGRVIANKGSVIKIANADLSANHDANLLAYTLDYVDVTKFHAQQDFDLADKALKNGDLTGAAYYIKEGQKLINNLTVGPNLGPDNKPTAVGSVLDILTTRVRDKLNQIIHDGGVIPPAVMSDYEKKLVDAPSDFVPVAAKGEPVAKVLFGDGTTPGALALDSAGNVKKSLDIAGREQAVVAPGWVLRVDEKGSFTLDKLQGTGWNNGPIYNQKGEVTITIKTGGFLVPAQAKYTVGRIGSMSVGGQSQDITGKMVTIGNEMWVENPARPGQWMPMVAGQNPGFVAPDNWKLGSDFAGAGNLPDVSPGTPVYHWTGGDQAKGGPAEYVMAPDEANGGFHLWQYNAQTKAWINRGTGLTPAGNLDQSWMKALNGFGIDRTTLNQDQRTVLNLVDMGINKTGGAFFNTTSSDLLSFYTGPGALQYLASGPGSNPFENAFAILTGKAKIYEYLPLGKGPSAAPKVTTYQTAAGGTRTVAEGGAGPAPVGSPYVYEGGPESYTPTPLPGTTNVISAATGFSVGTIKPPPAVSATPKAAPIATVTSSTGVTRTVSTGKTPTPVGKPAIYDTNPTPIKAPTPAPSVKAPVKLVNTNPTKL